MSGLFISSWRHNVSCCWSASVGTMHVCKDRCGIWNGSAWSAWARLLDFSL